MGQTMHSKTQMTAAPRSLELLPSSSGKNQDARKHFESLWIRYLDWRGGYGHRDGLIPLDRNSIGQGTSGSTFGLLTEIEGAARGLLAERCSSEIPFEFVMALMETAADTTARFMLANAKDAARFQRVAFNVLWDGLSAIDAPDHRVE